MGESFTTGLIGALHAFVHLVPIAVKRVYMLLVHGLVRAAYPRDHGAIGGGLAAEPFRAGLDDGRFGGRSLLRGRSVVL